MKSVLINNKIENMENTFEVQISNDQNKVIINGLLLDFVPVKRIKKTHCCYCWLLLGISGFDCADKVPCRSSERRDRKNGYYSIREMPDRLVNN
jgi:hypothetical protein